MSQHADLLGRTAIVTGAGKGLGRAYAIHLANRGAFVLVNNRRHAGEDDNHTSAMQTVESIRQAGGQAHANWCDVCDPQSGHQMVAQALEVSGRLDIVVANAGIDRASSFHKQGMADFREVFDTGFFGNLHLAHAAWPHLIRQGQGRLILTTSSAGLYANHGQAAYSAAKAAVIGLMRALALEGRRHGVRVNAIAPYGYSQMTAPYMNQAMGIAFDPGLVAPLVGWLASEACDVSGEVLVCGAGWIRRAASGESPAVPMAPEAPQWAVHALASRPLSGHDCANDSFATFLRECGFQTEETPT